MPLLSQPPPPHSLPPLVPPRRAKSEDRHTGENSPPPAPPRRAEHLPREALAPIWTAGTPGARSASSMTPRTTKLASLATIGRQKSGEYRSCKKWKIQNRDTSHAEASALVAMAAGGPATANKPLHSPPLHPATRLPPHPARHDAHCWPHPGNCLVCAPLSHQHPEGQHAEAQGPTRPRCSRARACTPPMRAPCAPPGSWPH
mmetsp:Transcript_70531/g.143248  ORF Transcript_70531/g.143248 Transcript_70531/m.143248 type:complete len:202 (-) Transcript_70531:188-793(-)